MVFTIKPAKCLIPNTYIDRISVTYDGNSVIIMFIDYGRDFSLPHHLHNASRCIIKLLNIFLFAAIVLSLFIFWLRNNVLVFHELSKKSRPGPEMPKSILIRTERY